MGSVRWWCVLALGLWALAGCGDDTDAAAAPMAGIGGGAGAGAMPTAVATITPFGGGPVTASGTATFTQMGTSVTVVVSLTGCTAGKMYPVHIHAGTACDSAMAQGDHWGPTRGEGIPKVTCTGTTGTAMLTRPPTDPTLAWTIGGDPATNVVGHAFVVHDPDVAMAPPRIGCGVITMR